MIDNDENTVGRKHCGWGWGGINYVYNEVFKSKQNKLYVNKVSIIIMIRLGMSYFRINFLLYVYKITYIIIMIKIMK